MRAMARTRYPWLSAGRGTSPPAPAFPLPTRVARSGGRRGAAEARRRDWHRRLGQRAIELGPDDVGLVASALPVQALVVAVQAPDVVGVLAGTPQGAVQPQVGPVDRLGVLQPVLLEQQCPEGVAGRLHPSPRLVVEQVVVPLDRVAEMRERLLGVALAVLDLAVQHRLGDAEDVAAGVVEQVAALGHPADRVPEQLALTVCGVDVAR